MTSPPLLADHTLPDVCHTVSGRAAALAAAGSCLSPRILPGCPPWSTQNGATTTPQCRVRPQGPGPAPFAICLSFRAPADPQERRNLYGEPTLRSSCLVPPEGTRRRELFPGPQDPSTPFAALPRARRTPCSQGITRSTWRTHGLPPQSVNRDRRHPPRRFPDRYAGPHTSRHAAASETGLSGVRVRVAARTGDGDRRRSPDAEGLDDPGARGPRRAALAEDGGAAVPGGGPGPASRTRPPTPARSGSRPNLTSRGASTGRRRTRSPTGRVRRHAPAKPGAGGTGGSRSPPRKAGAQRSRSGSAASW